MLQKTERITVMVLPRDKKALERIARSEGEAMAVVLRRMIRARARELETKDGSQNADSHKGNEQGA